MKDTEFAVTAFVILMLAMPLAGVALAIWQENAWFLWMCLPLLMFLS